MRDRPPLLEEPCAQTLSGIRVETCKKHNKKDHEGFLLRFTMNNEPLIRKKENTISPGKKREVLLE
jgi:hypothetical protein